MEYTLQPEIAVVVSRASIGIAANRPGAVGEGKSIAVYIETGQDGEIPGTLQSVQH